MSRRVGLYGEPKPSRGGGGAKASPKWAPSRTGQTRSLSDLPLARVKGG